MAILLFIYKLRKARGQNVQNSNLTRVGQQNALAQPLASSITNQAMGGPIAFDSTSQSVVAIDSSKKTSSNRMPKFVLVNPQTGIR